MSSSLRKQFRRWGLRMGPGVYRVVSALQSGFAWCTGQMACLSAPSTDSAKQPRVSSAARFELLPICRLIGSEESGKQRVAALRRQLICLKGTS